jgi:hypothetical protein
MGKRKEYAFEQIIKKHQVNKHAQEVRVDLSDYFML